VNLVIQEKLVNKKNLYQENIFYILILIKAHLVNVARQEKRVIEVMLVHKVILVMSVKLVHP
jgi:hypothetical protein